MSRLKHYFQQTALETFSFDSHQNYEMNFSQWEKGVNKTLYVTGLMGSGKSTYAKNLAQKHSCQHLNLDTLQQRVFDIEGKVTSDELYITRFKTELAKVIARYDKLIVEGVQLLWFPEVIAPTDSVLILNVSFLRATFQSIQRDGLKNLFNNLSNNVQFQKDLKRFKNRF